MSGGRRLMKAGPGIALAGAVAGFAGVLGLHGLAAQGSKAGSPAGLGSGKPAVASEPPARSAGRGASSHPATTAPSRQASGAARSATGPTEQFGYGSLAVRVTVRGSRIVAVTVTGLQTLEPTSQQISAQAIPVLRSEVITAQSVNVQGVTGASYTSEAYLKSAQAALDTLHAG